MGHLQRGFSPSGELSPTARSSLVELTAANRTAERLSPSARVLPSIVISITDGVGLVKPMILSAIRGAEIC